MTILRKLLVGSLAGAALAASAAAALAYPGVATGSVNVRTGPGTSYAIVDTLQPGEGVDIGQCVGSWCQVAYDDSDGWVAAAYLDRAGYEAPIYAPPPVYVEPPVFIGPPIFHNRPPFHHRPPVHFPHSGGGNPPGNFHPHPPGNFHPHPPGVRPPGGGNFCAANPAACQGGHHRRH